MPYNPSQGLKNGHSALPLKAYCFHGRNQPQEMENGKRFYFSQETFNSNFPFSTICVTNQIACEQLSKFIVTKPGSITILIVSFNLHIDVECWIYILYMNMQHILYVSCTFHSVCTPTVFVFRI